MEGIRYPVSLLCKGSHSCIVRNMEESFPTTQNFRTIRHTYKKRAHRRWQRYAPSSITPGFSRVFRGLETPPSCWDSCKRAMPRRVLAGKDVVRTQSKDADIFPCCVQRAETYEGRIQREWRSLSKHQVSLCARVDGATGRYVSRSADSGGRNECI
jgi:hypothetical protein